MNDKRIGIVGLGGVGGTVGAMLAKHHEHVIFFARGKRLESIRNRGLTLQSAAYGEMTVFPEAAGDDAAELGVVDYLFLCVKNYTLEEVCAQIAPMVSDDTVIIPLLNGIDVSERVRRVLNQGIVLDALVYVVTGTDEEFIIHHTSPYCRIHLGVTDQVRAAVPETERILSEVRDLLEGAGLQAVIEYDIEAAIWKKYILNCAYNVVTAYYNATTDDLRANEQAIKELTSLLAEACLVARSLGIKIPADLETTHLEHILNFQAGASTSSLKRDIEAGRPNELDVFSGKLLDLAAGLDVSIPVTEYFYQRLRKRSVTQAVPLT